MSPSDCTLPNPQQFCIRTKFRSNPCHIHGLYALMASRWTSLNRHLMCMISGVCYKVAEKCALLGYYHYSLRNNPRERSCQQLNSLFSNAEQSAIKLFILQCRTNIIWQLLLPAASNLLSRMASVCAEMTQDYRQHCGQFICKSNYCWTETSLSSSAVFL